MNTSTQRGRNSESKVLHEFKEAHIEEIQMIALTLVKITNLSEELVKPHLDAMLEQLVKSKQERPVYETATASEWIQAFRSCGAKATNEIHHYFPIMLLVEQVYTKMRSFSGVSN